MRQIKIFKSVETEVRTLEQEVNDWIKQSQVNVKQITGNIAPQTEKPDGSGFKFPPSDVLILVEYEAD